MRKNILFNVVIGVMCFLTITPLATLGLAIQCSNPTQCSPATETCDFATKKCVLRGAPPTNLNGGVDIGSIFGINFYNRAAPNSVGGFINSLLDQIYTVALILVLVYLVWGAYRYMIAGGDLKQSMQQKNS